MRLIPTILALSACAGLVAAEGGGAKSVRFSGTITAIEANQVTISKGGDGGGAKSETVTVTATTQILLETDQVAAAGGEGGKKQVTNPGALKDLAVGDPVTASYDGSKQAVTIVEHLPKKAGGGEGKKAAGVDKPAGGEKKGGEGK